MITLRAHRGSRTLWGRLSSPLFRNGRLESLPRRRPLVLLDHGTVPPAEVGSVHRDVDAGEPAQEAHATGRPADPNAPASARLTAFPLMG
jgi:hypothetical protein